VAVKYQMKKEIDYSLIDLYLNEPTDKTGRPLKLHSTQESDRAITQLSKRAGRFFGINDEHFGQNIVDEARVKYRTEDAFLLTAEDMARILRHYSRDNQPTIDKHEMQYIFEYNNRKINDGCKLLYHKAQQRKTFFDCMEYLCYYYGFKNVTAPEMYEQFTIPGKGFSGAGYFQRLRAMMLYKPQQVAADGKLDLFLKMEKIKLAYIVVKTTFKINVLQEMGFDFLALPSQFELSGKGGNDQIQGGVDGENVRDSWPFYSLFVKTNVVRNYFNNNVGLEIAFKIYLSYFFVAFATPYLAIYILETYFRSVIFTYTNLIKFVLSSIGLKIYLTLWAAFEDNYVEKFLDDVSSKVFRNDFRGPYVRNVISDELNEYEYAGMTENVLKNFVCSVIWLAVMVIFGAVFHGTRMLLLAIFDGMAKMSVSFVSLPHLLAYSVFIGVVVLFKHVLLDKLIHLIVLFKNPPSDDDAR
jgi:hypothetical protein